MKVKNYLKMLVSMTVIPLFVGLAFSVALAATPPPQNSAHLDGQNTDLSDNTLTITIPAEDWSDNSVLGEGELSMTGVGAGLGVVEWRNESAILATPYHKEGSTYHYFVRKYDDAGTPEWDFPTGAEEYDDFTGFASFSAPLV